MKRVRSVAAVRRGISERPDDLQLLDNGAGPAVSDDEGQRVFVFRTNVNEMDVEAVDLRDEVGERLEFCFAFAPVVVGAPVLRELLHRRELHALRRVGDSFPLGPPGPIYASA